MGLCIETAMITDESAELDGVWMDYESGARLKLARWDNEQSQLIQVEGYQEHRAVIDAGGDAAREIMKNIEIEAASKAVVRDWAGFVDPKGKDVPCTEDNVRKYLTMSKDFRNDVKRMSIGRGRYLVQNIKADAEKAKK